MGLFCFSADVFLVLLAILFPPLPVWIKRGICSADSLINIALCMLGFIPGLLVRFFLFHIIFLTAGESQTNHPSSTRGISSRASLKSPFSTPTTLKPRNLSATTATTQMSFIPAPSSSTHPSLRQTAPLFVLPVRLLRLRLKSLPPSPPPLLA